MNIARVIVDLSLDRYFDYIIPEELIAEIKPGSQVLVPFGHSRRLGFVTALVETPDTANKLKQIAALPPNKTSIPEKLLRLSDWMAHYYCTSMECAVKTLFYQSRIGYLLFKKIHKRPSIVYSFFFSGASAGKSSENRKATPGYSIFER